MLRILCKACLAGLVVVVAAILVDLVRRGWPLLGIDYLLAAPLDQGRRGGVLPVLWTTVQVVGLGTALAVPLALAAAIVVTEIVASRSRAGRRIADVLRIGAGVPAIVWGLACGAVLADLLGMGVSRMTGILTLAAMLAPGAALGFIAALQGVPAACREQCLSLGLSRWQCLVLRVIPAAAPAMVTSFGTTVQRGVGDAAALVLTAGFATGWATSLGADGATLAVHVYALVQVVPGALPAACAAAATLLVLTLVIQILMGLVEALLRRLS
ncbi:MAG: ABC transporter permease subunit [Phycisphaerales bacterium]|jgi:phosphate transport system permease protein